MGWKIYDPTNKFWCLISVRYHVKCFQIAFCASIPITLYACGAFGSTSRAFNLPNNPLYSGRKESHGQREFVSIEKSSWHDFLFKVIISFQCVERKSENSPLTNSFNFPRRQRPLALKELHSWEETDNHRKRNKKREKERKLLQSGGFYREMQNKIICESRQMAAFKDR